MPLTSVKGKLPALMPRLLLQEKYPVPEPWCVLLASREGPRCPRMTVPASPGQQPAPHKQDALTATLRRAATLTSLDRIAAIIADPVDHQRRTTLRGLGIRNVFVQPKHQGTAYEVLLALLLLESRTSAATTVLFLPADHIVNDEVVMTNSLMTMGEW